MIWLAAIGAIVCGWTMLSVLGGERQRRLERLRLAHAAARRESTADSRPKPADLRPRSAWPTRPGQRAKQGQR
jgi:hypothetical protein